MELFILGATALIRLGSPDYGDLTVTLKDAHKQTVGLPCRSDRPIAGTST